MSSTISPLLTFALVSRLLVAVLAHVQERLQHLGACRAGHRHLDVDGLAGVDQPGLAVDLERGSPSTGFVAFTGYHWQDTTLAAGPRMSGGGPWTSWCCCSPMTRCSAGL